MTDYPTVPALIAGLRRGEHESLQLVRESWANWKGGREIPAFGVRALSDSTKEPVSISRLFDGIKPTTRNAGELSPAERMNRIADLLETAARRKAGIEWG
jgi:hypothetical protein